MTKRSIRKADPNSVSESGEFDIVLGARMNSLETVKAALEENPNCINRQGEAGFTALHWACSNRNWEIFDVLLTHGPEKANPWIEDVRGKRPVDLAIERLHGKRGARLREKRAGADVAIDDANTADEQCPVTEPCFWPRPRPPAHLHLHPGPQQRRPSC